MKTLKLLPVAMVIATMMAAGPSLYGQDADEGTPPDETVGTETQTPFGAAYRFSRRDSRFRALGIGFVDEDGNGINDRLEDSDGDGVINAHDPDSPLYRDPATRGVFGRGLGFVDENGDGINDRLQDSDGDGVINAHDPDSPLYRDPATRGAFGRGLGFVDENGDGINDCLEDSDGDGVINALDPDSDLYRSIGRRGSARGISGRAAGKVGMQRGSAFGERGRALGRGRSGIRGNGTSDPADGDK